jgi:hypothetical protein
VYVYMNIENIFYHYVSKDWCIVESIHTYIHTYIHTCTCDSKVIEVLIPK